MADQPLPKVLLVEDDPGFLYLIRRYAETAGCELFAAADFQKALALAETERPTLVLVSDRPGVTGQELVRDLAANPATRHIPIFLCSTSDSAPSTWREAATGFLLKPVMYEDFLNILAEAGRAVQPAASQAASSTIRLPATDLDYDRRRPNNEAP